MHQEFAIISAGLRFPKNICSLQEFWNFLCEQGDATQEVPADRWDIKRFFDADYDTPGKSYMRRGAFLDQALGYFEPRVFGISPREAALMDPQQRLLLEVCWEAFERARIVPSNLRGENVGVFIGSFSLDWLVSCGSPFNRSAIKDHFSTTAASATMLSARLAHVFGLRGPCLTLDTACSSSMVAIHSACLSLAAHDCDMAVAGGVNYMLNPQAAMPMSKGHFLAKDGRSKSFDEKADGYGRGEGAGILLIKRLEDALESKDSILAVISASGVNHDGGDTSLTLPNGKAQKELIESVIAKAKISPDQIDYVEAHGTGTPVGDPIETFAISQAIASKKRAAEPLVIGAVKANIGHLEASAGVAGILKVIVCLQHRSVPSQANLKNINPNIKEKEWNLKIPLGKEISFPNKKVLYAGVNSFGYGGTNSIAIIRSLSNKEQDIASHIEKCSAPILKNHLLFLSSPSEGGLHLSAENYAEYLSENDSVELSNICYSVAQTRTVFQYRRVFMGETRQELLEDISKFIKNKENIKSEKSSVLQKNGPVLVFSGMGSQWDGMVSSICSDLRPSVRKIINQFDDFFKEKSGWSLLSKLTDETVNIHQTEIAQPAICLMQIAIWESLKLCGIQPSAVVGHSVGEVAAAYCAGALSLQDTAEIIYIRSQLQGRLSGQGMMLAIGCNRNDVEKVIQQEKLHVSLAAINSSSSCTVSGNKDDLEKLEIFYQSKGAFVRFLKVDVPYHSYVMEQIRENMLSELSDIKSSSPMLPIYSTVTGDAWQDEMKHDASYWYLNARQPVEFKNAIQAILNDNVSQIFLEVGPHSVLTPSLKDISSETDKEIKIVYSGRRNNTPSNWLEMCLARLAVAGCCLNWKLLTGGVLVDLPTYRWNREFFWSECLEGREDRLGANIHPILGTPLRAPYPAWLAMVNVNYMTWLDDHIIEGHVVFPGAAYIEGALALGFVLKEREGVLLQNFNISSPLVIEKGREPEIEWIYNSSSNLLTASSRISNVDDAHWSQHMSVELVASPIWTENAKIDFSQVEWKEFSPENFYSKLETLGLLYGAQFQTIKSVGQLNTKIIGKIELSPCSIDEVNDYHIHPALLDGAFQLLAIAVNEYTEFSENSYVPTVAERIFYYGKKTTQLICCLTIEEIGARRIVSDIQLYDEDGSCVMSIQGLVCKALPKASAESKFEKLLYKTEWQEVNLPPMIMETEKIVLIGQEQNILPFSAFLEKNFIDNVCVNDEKIQVIKDIDYKNCKRVVVFCPEGEGNYISNSLLHIVRIIRNLKLFPAFQDQIRLCAVIPEGRDNFISAGYKGLLRGIELERPDLKLKIIRQKKDYNDQYWKELCSEILSDDLEDEVLIQNDNRYLPRIVPFKLNKREKKQRLITKDNMGILRASGNGALDKMFYEVYPKRLPEQGEVMCKILASGINFKDVLKAMNLLPELVVDGTFYGNSLGMEAVIEVISLGEGCNNLQIGQKYIAAFPQTFATHCYLREEDIPFIVKLPANFDPLQAASLPVAFLTAWYALNELAHIQAGEIVLIHSASGGVGLAAIQIAKLRGARVFATAGNEEKREYLRSIGCEHVWSSRTLEFSEEILHITKGKGVDVVLNSLSGEFLVSTLRCLASFGRFIEIGKRDIIERNSLPMIPFNNNLSFFSVDLDRMLLERPQLIENMMQAMQKLMEEGTIQALPLAVYPANKTIDAFRFLASAKHIGKVVIDYQNLDNLEGYAALGKIPQILPDASYLITGAFGGLGLETAQWLIDAGARNLILNGRNPSDNEVVQHRLQSWKALGVNIYEAYFDIANEDKVAKNISYFENNAPNIKGVFHCACVFHDSLIENITLENLDSVLRAKALGARILDSVTRHLNLDFFVLFSSVTTTIGNIGQSAYIAANTILNQIAMERREAGLPAIALQLGPVGDVGILSRNQKAADTLMAAGMKLLNIQNVLEFLPNLTAGDVNDIFIADIDWEQWLRVVPLAAQLSRFSAMHHLSGNSDFSSETLLAFCNLPEAERLPFMVHRMQIIIGNILHQNPDEIDIDAKLVSLGLDSLAAVELQTAIKMEFSLEVSMMLLGQDDTIRSLVKKFYDQLLIKMAAKKTEESA